MKKINPFPYLSQLRSSLLALIPPSLLCSLLLSPLALPVQAQGEFCTLPDFHVATPLNDLGAGYYVRMDGTQTNAQGGLYPGGSNTRPGGHNLAGIALAQQIQPLDVDGNPDPSNGKIGFVAIGMSNAFIEFLAFEKMAKDDAEIHPKMVIVDGAQGGQTAEDWADPLNSSWEILGQHVAHKKLAPAQVQVAWIKNVHTGPGTFPEKPLALQADLLKIVQNLKTKYPNVKLAYMASRTRSYTYPYGLSPEPAAYESGFAYKWLIEEQINGDPELNYNPQRGMVKAPWLSWSPYLWADGNNPRSDGLVWTAEDMEWDCTHPSDQGAAKIGVMLMDFFKTNSTTMGWFLASPPDQHHPYLPLVEDAPLYRKLGR